MPARWSVQSAKAKLSEVLARARAGEPLGACLADSAPKGPPLVTASRASKRGDPFALANKPVRKRAKR